jgi:FlaA1/EpsC-like NDP-sugar epimerase
MIKLAGFIPDKDIMIKIVGLRPGEKLWRIA